MEFLQGVQEFIQSGGIDEVIEALSTIVAGASMIVAGATVLAKFTATKKDDKVLGKIDDALNRVANITLKDKRK